MQASTTKSSKKVPLFFYTLYIEGEGSEGSGEGEVIVRVNIADVNDNAPRFEAEGAEIVASVPTTAQYGHHVTRIQVICWKRLVLSHLSPPPSLLPDSDDIGFKVLHIYHPLSTIYRLFITNISFSRVPSHIEPRAVSCSQPLDRRTPANQLLTEGHRTYTATRWILPSQYPLFIEPLLSARHHQTDLNPDDDAARDQERCGQQGIKSLLSAVWTQSAAGVKLY